MTESILVVDDQRELRLLVRITLQPPGVDMIATAENLATEYGLSHEVVDGYALNSHQQALRAQASQRLPGN